MVKSQRCIVSYNNLLSFVFAQLSFVIEHSVEFHCDHILHMISKQRKSKVPTSLTKFHSKAKRISPARHPLVLLRITFLMPIRPYPLKNTLPEVIKLFLSDIARNRFH